MLIRVGHLRKIKKH